MSDNLANWPRQVHFFSKQSQIDLAHSQYTIGGICKEYKFKILSQIQFPCLNHADITTE